MEAVGPEAARDIIFCTLRSNVKITRCSIDRNSHRDIIPRSPLQAQYSEKSSPKACLNPHNYLLLAKTMVGGVDEFDRPPTP